MKNAPIKLPNLQTTIIVNPLIPFYMSCVNFQKKVTKGILIRLKMFVSDYRKSFKQEERYKPASNIFVSGEWKKVVISLANYLTMTARIIHALLLGSTGWYLHVGKDRW